MTRYSFTGPSKLTADQAAMATQIVDALEDPIEITTGAAGGWDTEIALRAVEAWPRARHRVICPGASFFRQGVQMVVDLAILLGVEKLEVISLPPEITTTRSYRVRNEKLVDAGDVIVAAVRSLSFYRSGEWMTANIAKKAGKPIQWVELTS